MPEHAKVAQNCSFPSFLLSRVFLEVLMKVPRIGRGSDEEKREEERRNREN